jgi:hypothetical protein
VGSAINPNFASELLLRSIPGLNDSAVASILARRREGLFADANDLRVRTGLSAESPAWKYLTLERRAPSVFVLSKVANGVTRSERRVTHTFNTFNFLTGVLEPKSAVGRVERNRIASYAGPRE